MRILMLAQFYPKTIGGEEQHVQDLAIWLAKRGHQVSVATVWHPGLSEFEMDHGVHVYRIHGTTQRAAWLFKESDRRHAPPFPDPELTLALKRIISRERPQIVHAHNWLVHSFLPLKPWSRAKLVLTLHDYSLVCSKKSMMQTQGLCSGPGVVKCLACATEHYGALKGVPTVFGMSAMRAIERMTVDKFIAVSHATAIGNGLVNSTLPYEVIPNFVPEDHSDGTEDYAPFLAQLPKTEFLLFVGDVGERKGIQTLLNAYAGLPSAPPLVLIGRRLPEAPTEFPPNVLVMDQWPHGAVMQAWSRSLLALAPSVWPEPFGIVVLEAMSAGCPVIASRIGGLTDAIMDQETGVLVPPGDAGALRDAIAALLANPRMRAEMGQAARRRAAEFQAAAIVPRIEQVYQTLLEQEPVTKPVTGLEQVGQSS